MTGMSGSVFFTEGKEMPKSLQTFHQVEIGQSSDVAVHVGLPIRREFDTKRLDYNQT